MLFVALLIGAAATASKPGSTENPLPRAEQGQLQCYEPDTAKKTCHSIAEYRRTGPGDYDNKAIVAVGNGLTLETHSPITLKGGAVCGLIKSEDVMAGTLRV